MSRRYTKRGLVALAIIGQTGLVVFAAPTHLIDNGRTKIREVFWTKESFPDPLVDQEACRSTPESHICDPDFILEDSVVAKLQQRLLENRLASPPTTTLDGQEQRRSDGNVEISVAMLRKVGFPSIV